MTTIPPPLPILQPQPQPQPEPEPEPEPEGAAAGPCPPPVPVLAVPVGPPVRTARDLWTAIGFHARLPEAAARPGRLGRFLWGAGQAVHAAGRVVADPALRRAAVVPTVLTVLGCAALAGWSTWRDLHDPEVEADALGAFHVFFVAFMALASMPPTLLQRQWIRVALEARRALGLPDGHDPHAHRGYVALVASESLKAVRQVVLVAVAIFPVVVVARMAGRAGAGAVAGAWAFYWVVIDALELPAEVRPGEPGAPPAPWFSRAFEALGRRSRLLWPVGLAGRLGRRLARPWDHEAHFTERHPWETAGFATVMGVILAVPVIGLCFRAAGIAGATALLGRLQPARIDAGREASGPARSP